MNDMGTKSGACILRVKMRWAGRGSFIRVCITWFSGRLVTGGL